MSFTSALNLKKSRTKMMAVKAANLACIGLVMAKKEVQDVTASLCDQLQ